MTGNPAACTPDVNRQEQEQPDNVNEVPIPGGSLEAEMMLRCKIPSKRAHQAHEQEDRADDNVETVETGRHEKHRAVNVAREAESGMTVFIGLAGREQHAKDDGDRQAPDQALTVVMQQGMVGPSDCRAREQQDERVDEG